MAVQYSKSIDDINNAGTENRDDDTTSTNVIGSMSNVEEEKEEEYINALLVDERLDESTIKYNGYSMTSGSSEYSRYLYGQNRMKSKLNFGIDSTKNLIRRKMKQKKKKTAMDTNDMNEDGYNEMRRPSKSNIYDRKMSPMLKRVVKKPIKVLKKIISKQRETQITPGTLILVRHGESTWNKNKTFTGWADPDLTLQGTREVEHAARLLMEGGYHYDIHIVFTSRLTRAIRSTWILLQEFNEVYLPVFKSWRLNERHYGALTALNKTQTAERLGEDLVQSWRGSLKSRPPPLTDPNNSIYYPGNDRKYADLTKDQLPLTESLLDCMERTKPLWENKIVYELNKGRNVLVVAHANTLRGLVKTIDNIGDEEIQEIAIPTGIPIVYKFKKVTDTTGGTGTTKLISIDDAKDDGLVSQVHMKGKFLEKPGLLKEALKLEEGWKARVPGYDPIMQRQIRPMTGLERSLYKLNAVRELGEWANEFIDLEKLPTEENDDGNGVFFTANTSTSAGTGTSNSNETSSTTSTNVNTNTNMNANGGADSTMVPLSTKEESVAPASASSSGDDSSTDDVIFGGLEEEEDDDDEEEDVGVPTYFAQPCVVPAEQQGNRGGEGTDPSSSSSSPTSPTTTRQNVIVIIRHGKTQHNKLGLFTGWEDAPLAEEGIEEAKQAGRDLKKFGFEFDVVYTSWLSRALETAWLVMDEMDSLWLPIVKTWRLNERMYGELTGLSKQMVKQRHGEKQFKAWRRGYAVRPPPVSSFSKHYPGNDPRYQKYLRDVRYSLKESAIRSIEQGKPMLVRKLPKSESLKDCMDRTMPYFIERIAKDAVDQNKRVLISSSENAIRGLLMHLCSIPESEISGLEIPNGLPLIYDTRSKCVKLLDDGSGRDPLEVYNFGSSAKYLFRPCQNDDGSLDEECSINFDNPTFQQPVEISSKDQAILDSITGKGKKKTPTSTPSTTTTTTTTAV